MGMVQLPGVRGRGDGERAALRRGLATGAPLRLASPDQGFGARRGLLRRLCGPDRVWGRRPWRPGVLQHRMLAGRRPHGIATH